MPRGRNNFPALLTLPCRAANECKPTLGFVIGRLSVALAIAGAYLGVDALAAIPKTNPHAIFDFSLVLCAVFVALFLALGKMWRTHLRTRRA